MATGAAAAFHDRVTAALRDERLRGALGTLVSVFGERRRTILATTPAWNDWRDQARAVKDDVLANLDGYLEQFAARATQAGATVHRAHDATDACTLVLDLIRAAGASRIVKSKSMATEEIHLNAALERAGLAPIETDLGEWIIQQAGESPSHIVVPAIHKSRRQIAELFAKTLETPLDDDVATLTAAARGFLRDRFAEAEVGISGVNFAIAETGSILILENEGNARLTTSLPRMHIAVMGIEKVIPRIADLDVFLKLLPRAGTGQRLTAYQSLITGARGHVAGEGPETLHLVLLDAGRSRMLRDPLSRQTLACIRCGACLNVCPVYQEIGGHAYGSVYPGPIGAVLTPQLDDAAESGHLPFASSLCGACRDACPVKIDIPALLLRLRARAVEGVPAGEPGRPQAPSGSTTERMAFRAFRLVASRPWAFSAVGRLGRVVAPMLFSRSHLTAAGRLIARAVAPLAAWAATRDVRPIPARSFRESWRAGGSASERAAGAHVDATLAGRTVQGPAPALPDPATAPTDLVASFVSAVESVAGTCTVVASQEGAVDAVNAFIRSRNARRVAVSDSAFARAVVGQCAVDELVGTDAAALFTADIGVTSAQWGIAETGTLVLASRAEHHRLASLVPTAHVALLDARGLRGTLGEVLFEIGPGGHDSLGNCITFITGPSRTSDIELTPALGVHGPTALHVVVLAEPRDRATDTRLGKTEGR